MINSTINNRRWVIRTITQFLVTGIFLATASHVAAQNQPPDLVILQSDLSRADFSGASSGTPNTSSRPGDLRMPSVTTRSLRGFFIQSTLRIRNTGRRIIYLVNWDYILSDRKSEQEVAHFQFQDKVILRPNKTETLWSMIDESRDISQNQAPAKNYIRGRYHERVAITFIEYADGTIWRFQNGPNNTTSDSTIQSSPLSSPGASGAPKLNGSQSVPPPSKPATATNQMPKEVGNDDVLRVDTQLVTVPVIVTDSRGHYVTDIKEQELHVYEDGVEQPIFSFSQVEQPFFVVLLLDISGSTTWTLDELKKEAIAFIDQLRPNDYVYVLAFDGTLHALHQQATNDRELLREAIKKAQPGGSTSLYDAINSVNNRILKPAPGRKAFILFTDGGENTSLLGTRKSTLHDAAELDALIYVVQYPPFDKRDYLKALVEATGGRLYNGENERKIREAFTALAAELRQQYAISYRPKSPPISGQSHNVNVVVARPDVKVKSRKTYTVR